MQVLILIYFLKKSSTLMPFGFKLAKNKWFIECIKVTWVNLVNLAILPSGL